jgi:uncharacterized protein YqcC (DUF446 family)
MDVRLPALADQLLLIERELRLLGWWAGVAPEDERLASTAPFCVDTLLLQEWLQWIFLPRMKVLVEQGGALPGACAIGPMAEHTWAGEGARVAALLALLTEFDRLISEPG